MNDLPPLPEPDWKEAWAIPGKPVAERWFGRAKMEAYAREAVMAERERCARLCEELIAWNEDDPGETAANHIRLGAQPGEWIKDHDSQAEAIRGEKPK